MGGIYERSIRPANCDASQKPLKQAGHARLFSKEIFAVLYYS
jgi:hypothetical protein